MSNGTRRPVMRGITYEPSRGFCRVGSRDTDGEGGVFEPGARARRAARCERSFTRRQMCDLRYSSVTSLRESTTRRTEKGRDREPGIDHVRVAHIANARTTSVDVLRSHRSLRSRHPRQLIRERIRSPHLAPPRRPRVAHHQTHPESVSYTHLTLPTICSV